MDFMFPALTSTGGTRYVHVTDVFGIEVTEEHFRSRKVDTREAKSRSYTPRRSLMEARPTVKWRGSTVRNTVWKASAAVVDMAACGRMTQDSALRCCRTTTHMIHRQCCLRKAAT